MNNQQNINTFIISFINKIRTTNKQIKLHSMKTKHKSDIYPRNGNNITKYEEVNRIQIPTD